MTIAMPILIAGLFLLFAFTFKCDALIKLGGGVTDIRGSMAGNTYSRNAGGNYMRARTKPINPRSPLQVTRRANLAHLTQFWSGSLTEQERTDWRAYADATNWTNRLGEAISINGLAAFVRLNTFLLMLRAEMRREAPTAVGHAGGVTIVFTAENDTGLIKIACPGGAFNEDNGLHLVSIQMGYPAEAGRIATPKGMRYIGYAYGKTGGGLTWPLELPTAYTMQNNQLITLRAMFKDENFRNSGPFWAHASAAPSG